MHTLSITQVANRTMIWVQSKELKQEYKLVLGDGKTENSEVVARLMWEKKTGSVAQAQFGGGVYKLQRRYGFFKTRITASHLDTGTQPFEYRPHWSFKGVRGLLTLNDGTHYEWRQTAAFKQNFAWFNMQGLKVMEFKNHTNWKAQTTTEMEITWPVVETTNLEMLAIFGEYLSLLYMKDAQASAASSGVVVTTF